MYFGRMSHRLFLDRHKWINQAVPSSFSSHLGRMFWNSAERFVSTGRVNDEDFSDAGGVTQPSQFPKYVSPQNTRLPRQAGNIVIFIPRIAVSCILLVPVRHDSPLCIVYRAPRYSNLYGCIRVPSASRICSESCPNSGGVVVVLIEITILKRHKVKKDLKRYIFKPLSVVPQCHKMTHTTEGVVHRDYISASARHF
jgi:hypothetical protein